MDEDFSWLSGATVFDDGTYHCVKTPNGRCLESAELLAIAQGLFQKLKEKQDGG